jgi:transcriptional regulator with XRE-family HTH domain
MRKDQLEQNFLHDVGLRIKNLRQARGYTLADLGENIGLDKSNTFRLEQGKNFTLLTLIKIAAFFNIHPHEILNVPFQIDFIKIEKAIADKKKARKTNTSLKKNQLIKSVETGYKHPPTTSALAADSGKALKKKKKKS